MVLPSQISQDVGLFDKFATKAEQLVSTSKFFALCLAIVVVWLPSYLLVRNFDTYQLIINTPTTIITFLLVSLMQNGSVRGIGAIQHKLNAIARYLADTAHKEDSDHVDELLAAVGLEERESTS